MTRTALNKGLIMRRVSGSHQAQSAATSSTSPTTDTDNTAHFPHERYEYNTPYLCPHLVDHPNWFLFVSSDVQSSAVFSDVCARVESGFNHFRSVMHDPGARVVAVSAVDKEVEATRQLLLSLLTRRNALAPVSLLPPEILARVFHFLVLEEEPPCSRGQDLGWIRATHVCRLWRQVALGDSSLWARISGFPSNTELISEMLARARNAPLDVDIDLRGASDPDVLLMLRPHVSHTRKLRLYSLSFPHSASVRDIYSREAPALEHFELGVMITSPITFRHPGGTTLFKGQAPRLRTFSLFHIFIPWSFIPRDQLTQLKIVLFDETTTPSHGDLNQLIDLLVTCPGLEILVLEHCLPSQLSQIPYGQTIHFPRLSRLCLGGSSSRITNLMKMLEIPSSTRLHLHCVSENASTHNDRLLLPVIAPQFQGPTTFDFKSLSVNLSSMSHLLAVTASTTLPSFKGHQFKDFEGDLDGDAEFVLSFDKLPEFGTCTDFLERVCKMLPISNVDFLSIAATDIDDDSVNWVELFKRLTKVTTIQVIGRATTSLVRALTTPKAANTKPNGKGKKKRRDNRDITQARSTSGAPADAPTIFPKLTSMALNTLDFNEGPHPSGILFNVVERGLQQRKAANKAPMKELRIDNCVITAKRAKALQKLVQRFHWDGDEGFVDEFEDFGDYDSDFVEPGARWEDFFVGTTQAEWEWWENYSDGY
jgi:hypothetical protein